MRIVGASPESGWPTSMTRRMLRMPPPARFRASSHRLVRLYVVSRCQQRIRTGLVFRTRGLSRRWNKPPMGELDGVHPQGLLLARDSPRSDQR